MPANSSCDEIIFDATNLLLLENVQDDGPDPAEDLDSGIVSATITDEADDSVIFGPIALVEFPASPSNDYRANFVASAANGFAVGQRVRVTYAFAGGGLVRPFPIVAIVVAA